MQPPPAFLRTALRTTRTLMHACASMWVWGPVVRDKEPQTGGEKCDPCGFDLLSSPSLHTINHYQLKGPWWLNCSFCWWKRQSSKKGERRWCSSREDMCVITRPLWHYPGLDWAKGLVLRLQLCCETFPSSWNFPGAQKLRNNQSQLDDINICAYNSATRVNWRSVSR